MLKELLKKNRSYRRFHEEERIPEAMLKDWIDNVRFCPSAANAQALRYQIIHTEEACAKVFPTLRWAAALPEWDGPKEGERPSAYVILLCDLTVGKNKMWDDGITAQTIMLSAAEQGFGGCMLANVDRPQLMKTLGLDPEHYSIDLVLALGKPKEDVRIVPVPEDGNLNYYRDEQQIHYVPKHSLEEILL